MPECNILQVRLIQKQNAVLGKKITVTAAALKKPQKVLFQPF